MTTPDRPADGPPLPLVVAVLVVGLEAVLLVGYGLAQVPAFTTGRATMVATSVVFFVVYGGALGWFAWLLHRLRSWTRAPVVLAQLIQIGVAWSFRGGSTSLLAAGLLALAVVVLVGIFHPASLRAVERADARDDVDSAD